VGGFKVTKQRVVRWFGPSKGIFGGFGKFLGLDTGKECEETYPLIKAKQENSILRFRKKFYL